MIIKFPAEKIHTKSLDTIQTMIADGQIRDALVELKRFSHKEPENFIVWTLIGQCYNALDLLDDARISFEKALMLNPVETRALTGLGIVFRKQNRDEEARKRYLEVLAFEPDNPWALSSLAIIELRNNEDGVALLHALKAYQLAPDEPEIAANLSVAFHYCGDFSQRDKMLKIAINAGYQHADRVRKFFTNELTIRKKP